jgi:hypothetical protein
MDERRNAMDSCYRWAMHRASAILFGFSVVLFLVGFAQALLMLKSSTGGPMVAEQPFGERLADFLLSGALAAFSSATLPFLGAVVVNRWDEKNKGYSDVGGK